MQRLKVNRHRPCLYRHYYLAVGFIVKPCQTEVFQPIFCSYTVWTTKSVIKGDQLTNLVPTYTIVSLCTRMWGIFVLLESLEQSHLHKYHGTRSFFFQVQM